MRHDLGSQRPGLLHQHLIHPPQLCGRLIMGAFSLVPGACPADALQQRLVCVAPLPPVLSDWLMHVITERGKLLRMRDAIQEHTTLRLGNFSLKKVGRCSLATEGRCAAHKSARLQVGMPAGYIKELDLTCYLLRAVRHGACQGSQRQFKLNCRCYDTFCRPAPLCLVQIKPPAADFSAASHQAMASTARIGMHRFTDQS